MTDTRRILLKESMEKIITSLNSMKEASQTLEKIRDAEMEEYESIPEEEQKTINAEDLSNHIDLMDNIIDAIYEMDAHLEDMEALTRI